MRLRWFSSIFLVFALGCAATGPGLLTRADLLRQFPEDRYIVGIGEAKLTDDLAACRRTAEDQARQDIASQIRVRVEGQVKSLFEEQSKRGYSERLLDAQRVSVSYFQTLSISTSEAVLEGVRIVESRPVPKAGMYQAVAVLDRRLAGASLAQRMAQSYAKAEQLIHQATSSDDFLRAFKLYIQARDRVAEAMAWENDFRILAGRPQLAFERLESAVDKPESRRPTLVSIDDALASLIADLSIAKVGGDGQVLTRSPSNLILSAELRFRGQPLTGYPVAFRSRTHQVSVDSVVRTDEKGVASAQILYVSAAVPQNVQIVASPKVPGVANDGKDPRFFSWVRSLLESKSVEFMLHAKRPRPNNLEAGMQALMAELSEKARHLKSPLRVAVEDLAEGETSAPTALGRYLSDKIRLAAGGNSLFRVVADRGGLASYVLTGKYWLRPSWVDVNVFLVDSLGQMVASASAQLDTAALELGTSVLAPTPVASVKSLLSDFSTGAGLQVSIWGPRGVRGFYRQGESFWFFLKANRPCYIYVVDFASDGKPKVLVPSQLAPNNYLAHAGTFRIPQELGHKFIVTPPFGTDVVKVFASERPLDIRTVLNSAQSPEVALRGVRGLAVQPTIGQTTGYAEASMVIVTGP